MEYTYKLPEILPKNIDKTLTLYGGYSVNLKYEGNNKNNNKLKVRSTDVFEQELFRSVLNKHGGFENLDKCLKKQNNYLDIYLYQQALERTYVILKNKIDNTSPIKYLEFIKPEEHIDLKNNHLQLINEYNSIIRQINNYKLLRRILKQNECIMDNLYDIRDEDRNILNLEKLNIDYDEYLYNYKLINYNLYNSITIQKINIRPNDNKTRLFSYFNEDIIDNWIKSNKKYLIIYVYIKKIMNIILLELNLII